MKSKWPTAVRQAARALRAAWAPRSAVPRLSVALAAEPIPSGGSAAATSGQPAREHARLRSLDLLMQGRSELWLSLLCAGLVSAAVWRFYPAWVSSLWLILFLVVQVNRGRIRRSYRLAPQKTRAERKWSRMFELNVFSTGCLWACTTSIFVRTPDPDVHAFVVFVLGGMAAGAVMVTAADLRAMYAFMAPAVLPGVGILLTRAAPADTALGLILAVFTIALAVTGRTLHASLLGDARLRIAQDELSAHLLASESAMEEAEAIAHVGRWESGPVSDTIQWSDEMYRIFGVERSTFQPLLANIRALVHPEDRAELQSQHEGLIARGTAEGIVHRIVTPSGTVKYVHQKSQITQNAAGDLLKISGTAQDITEQRFLEDKLEFNKTVLRAQIESSESGAIVVDDRQVIILFNRKFSEIWGVDLADLEAGNDRRVLAQVASKVRDRAAFEERVRYLQDHPEEPGHDDVETLDGRMIQRYAVSLNDPNGGYIGRAWFFTDVTERREAEARALRAARADVLTGLANRTVFIEALERAIAGARRGGAGFAVIYLDLDHFKDVNDTLGHAAGDRLLTMAADRMRAITREIDTIARFGGDEFALIAARTDQPAAVARFAEKLVQAFREPFEIDGRRVVSGASVGIDCYGPGSDQAETLLGHADVALYKAKADGRGCYRFFTPALDLETRARVALGVELREAIEGAQLFLLYQPQVGLESGQIRGVEALARWRHPTRGVLGPDLFIPLAEQIGLIAKLGKWVLQAACRDAKLWVDAGILNGRICVNISATQFRAPLTLEADVLAALRETGLAPERLELELTESVLMSASSEVGEALNRLHLAGVSLAIDDFGTGYSSIEYLRRFPAARIKIAQAFVENLESNPRDAAIVRATIGLARELGIQVIAEGVEVLGQFEILRSLKCPEVQGYLFARPLTAERLVPLLMGGRLRPRDGPDDAESNRVAGTPVTVPPT